MSRLLSLRVLCIGPAKPLFHAGTIDWNLSDRLGNPILGVQSMRRVLYLESILSKSKSLRVLQEVLPRLVLGRILSLRRLVFLFISRRCCKGWETFHSGRNREACNLASISALSVAFNVYGISKFFLHRPKDYWLSTATFVHQPTFASTECKKISLLRTKICYTRP